MPLKHLLFVSVLCLYAGLSAAQGADPPAGEYIFERGSGLLNVKPGGAFDISTVGANGHSCQLDGRIVGGKAKLDGSPCVVNFKTTARQWS